MSNLTIGKLLIGFFKLVLVFIGSWFLVHFFALLGIFVSIAHIITWFFFPKSTICISCITKKDGEYCKHCKKNLSKVEGTYPKRFLSVIYSSFIFFLVSLFSIAAVYVESRILKNVLYPINDKTVSFVIPSINQYKTGELFSMEIRLTGIETPINTVQADIGFDKDKLEILEISTKGSFATIFLQKEFNNDLGYARLSGGLPNPGYSGSNGLFGIVYFKSKSAGLAEVHYLDSTLVLANDGKGSNILKEYSTISYLITPEQVPNDEQELQKGLIMQSVLGIEDKADDQILLFETTNNSVLGATDLENTEVKGLDDVDEGNSIFDNLLHILESFDTFILTVLTSILEFITF